MARALSHSLLVAGLFLADRLTKVLALRHLRPIDGIPLAPFFHLTYVENTGAAFGMGTRRNGLFIVVAAVLLGGLLHLRRKWPKDNPWLQYGALLVIAGALGNIYDRIAYGFVVDFLDFRVWPVFNLADSCVTVGAFSLAWGLRKEDRRDQASCA
ncbi:MAG: signal peptidase II [Elusimicrobia bacterium]|nr:signal peptidase II [Elusimicrobiota bacterium]